MKMMQCGHAANARNSNGDPSCAICIGIHPGADVPVAEPDLSGRMARCSCGRTEASRLALAFFEFTGDGSRDAVDKCACGYSSQAHTPEIMARNKSLKCANFKPRGPQDYDRYYCGCRGWD